MKAYPTQVIRPQVQYMIEGIAAKAARSGVSANDRTVDVRALGH